MPTVPILWLVWLYLPRMSNVESVDSWQFFYKKYFYKRWQCWQLIVFFTKVPTHIFFVFYANFKADLAIFLRPNFFFKKQLQKRDKHPTNTTTQKREKRNIIRLKRSKERFRAELLWCVLLCLCTSSSSSVKRSVYYCSVTSMYYDIGLNAFVICLYLYIAPEKECGYDYDDERT